MNSDELLIALKDIFDKKADEIKQYVDDSIKGQSVLIENLQSTIKTVAEGHSVLNDKIDRIDSKVNSIEEQVDSVKKDIAVIKDYVLAVDAKLNEHEVILKRVK